MDRNKMTRETLDVLRLAVASLSDTAMARNNLEIVQVDVQDSGDLLLKVLPRDRSTREPLQVMVSFKVLP